MTSDIANLHLIRNILKIKEMSASQKLGRYLILEEIAQGGMAVVYRGKLVGVEGFEKEVAIKKILPYWSRDEEFLKMLIDEAKILVALHHPNIVQVIELGKEGVSYYLVMEFVNGLDLRRLTKALAKNSTKLPDPLIAYILKQICHGLDFAHNKADSNNSPLHIVHRDISPQNILIGREGEVKITDFGIAKTTQKSTQTQTGILKGKFAYMSPEQAKGEQIDHQTDLFATGLLLYELVFGKKLFSGKSDFEIIEKVREAKLELPDDTPAPLRTIFEKALAVDKGQRYIQAFEMAHDIETWENSFDKKAHARDLKAFLKEHCPELFQKRDLPASTLSSEDATAAGVPEQATVLNAGTEIQAKTLISTNSLAKTRLMDHEDLIKTEVDLSPIIKPWWQKRRLQIVAGVGAFVVLFGSWWTYKLMRSDPSSIPPIRTTMSARSNLESTLSKGDKEDTPQIDAQMLKGRLKIQASPEGTWLSTKLGDQEKKSQNVLELEVDVPETGTAFPVKVTFENHYAQTVDVKLDPKNLVFEKTVALKPFEYGSIKVYSRPWSTFRLKERGDKSYGTPRTIKAPVGEYTLSIYAPSVKRSVSRRIQIKKDQTLSCRASFAPKGSVYCK